MKIISLLFITSLFFSCVVTADLESVSVMDGDSLTLYTDLTELHIDDVIEWRFGNQLYLIAIIYSEVNKTLLTGGSDGRFTDRLKINDQTGDLTITDILSKHTGLYHLEIHNKMIPIKRVLFNVSGVLGDTNVVSVIEGGSVTLHTNVSDIHNYDVIWWRFQHGDSPLAELNKKAGIIPRYDDDDDDDDGRFRGSLMLDQSGSLTIKNIRMKHSGLYTVDFSSRTHTVHRSFTVTVSPQGLFSGVIAGMYVAVFLVIAAAVVGGVFYIHLKTHEKTPQEDIHKNILVNKGESVTLKTDVTEVKRDDVMKWMFGEEETLIAEINPANNNCSTHDDADDGLFRDVLELNHQTGDLTINNIRQNHTGLYTLKIIRRDKTSYRKFSVSVRDGSDGSVNVPLSNGDTQRR